jgi:branched-subunit amino acid transport protein
MGLWLTLLVVGALTYLQRAFFIAFGDSLPATIRLRRGLRFVPVSVLVALIVPDLLLVDDALAFSPGNMRLVAGLVAAGVAWRTRSVLWTLLAGMAALLLLKWLLSSLSG